MSTEPSLNDRTVAAALFDAILELQAHYGRLRKVPIEEIERLVTAIRRQEARSDSDALKRLDSFSDLTDPNNTMTDGWDSYGAKATNPEAIATARLMLTQPGFPFPTTDGGIAIEWDSETVTVDILPDGSTPERLDSVDVFIRDELPGLLAEALADEQRHHFDLDVMNTTRPAQRVAIKVRELHSERKS